MSASIVCPDMGDPDERGPGIERLKAGIDICPAIDCIANRQPLQCVMAETHSDGCIRADRHTIHNGWKRAHRKPGRINDHSVSVAFNTNDRHIHLQLDPPSVWPLCAPRIADREHVSSRGEYESGTGICRIVDSTVKLFDIRNLNHL